MTVTAWWPETPATTPPPEFLAPVRGRTGCSGVRGTPPTPLAAKLRSLRDQAGLTQTECAALLSVAQNRVSDWENGHNIPTLVTLQRYASAFNTTVAHLLDGVM
nr:helix-turn-helix transcriptional regulator [Mycobacterium sp. UM_NZ2]